MSPGARCRSPLLANSEDVTLNLAFDLPGLSTAFAEGTAGADPPGLSRCSPRRSVRDSASQLLLAGWALNKHCV